MDSSYNSATLRRENNIHDIEEVILKYWPQINYRVRNSLGYENSDWEDLAGDILINIIEALRHNKFRGESSIGTFIYTITTRRIIDYIRRKVRLQKYVREKGRGSNLREPDKKRERAVEIRDAIKKLKPRYADLLYLYYYSGLTQVEIAENLGLSLRTVNVQIRDAKLSLKKIIEK
jgi:RNA polymerase sigma-70 factor (ECF subfamily)